MSYRERICIKLPKTNISKNFEIDCEKVWYKMDYPVIVHFRPHISQSKNQKLYSEENQQSCEVDQCMRVLCLPIGITKKVNIRSASVRCKDMMWTWVLLFKLYRQYKTNVFPAALRRKKVNVKITRINSVLLKMRNFCKTHCLLIFWYN